MTEELKNKITGGFKSVLENTNSELLKDFRNTEFEKFSAAGFPTLKTEEWRHTPLKFLDEINFNIKTLPDRSVIGSNDVSGFLLKEIKENYIVTLDGFYRSDLSHISTMQNGLTICSLEEAFAKYPEKTAPIFEKNTDNYFNKRRELTENGFESLNAALFRDGLFIDVPENYSDDSVLHVVHILDVRRKTALCNTRTLVLGGKNSRIKIIESVHNLGDYAGFTNAVTDIHGAQGSNIEYYKLQNDSRASYYIGSSDIALEEDCNFHGVTVSLDGKFVRNNMNLRLAGEGSNVKFYGFFFATKDNFIDNHTTVDHAAAKCTSNEIYKGIVDGKSNAVFNGKILVRPGAQQTDAYQSNKNILLSDDAKINSSPQLVIFADDVKCSHGSSTGYLDHDSLFYLKSRGISESKAKGLLLNAFASDVFDKIKISALCDEVKNLTAKRLNLEEELYFCNFNENH